MNTRTIKIVSLCLLMLCSISAQAGVKDAVRTIKTQYNKALAHYPHGLLPGIFYVSMILEGGYLINNSQVLVAYISRSSSGGDILEKLLKLRVGRSVSLYDFFVATGGAAIGIGALGAYRVIKAAAKRIADDINEHRLLKKLNLEDDV